MGRIFFLAATTAALVGSYWLTAATAAPTTWAHTLQVNIDDYAFKAPAVTVRSGDTVTWKNLDDDPHTVTADDKSFDSKGMAQGDSFSFRFVEPGTYHYHCSVHPFMQGTVIVEESQK